ncbi:hypothetical protein D3C78_1422280 [compost metagenome]
MPGRGPAMSAARCWRSAGASPHRAFHEPWLELPRPVGVARQSPGEEPLRQTRLSQSFDLRHQTQERHQPAVVPGARPGSAVQSLCANHCRRSSPSRHRRAGGRCRGRLVYPGPWQPPGPMPRILERPDQRHQHDAVPEQKPDPQSAEKRRPEPAGPTVGGQCR